MIKNGDVPENYLKKESDRKSEKKETRETG